MRWSISLMAVLILTTAVSASARTWYIKADGTGDAPTIQAGVDLAADGDTILAAVGIYVGPGNKNIDLTGRSLVVISESGPEVTIIDCEDSGRGFYFGSLDSSAVAVARLEGFTITRGDVTAELDYHGGGIYHRCFHHAPTVIDNCIV
jgi:hypothetical protein